MKSHHTPAWAFYNDPINDWASAEALFSVDECERIMEHCRRYKKIKASAGNIKNIRDSKVVFVNPEGMEWVYDRITQVVKDANEKYFKFDLWGFQEGMQFAEYAAPTGRYETHIDRNFGTACRKLSTVLLLTDPKDYTGGELQLMLAGDKHPTPLTRTQGTLIMFPSFLPHRVTPVTKGKRHTLVGWVTGKPFK